MSSRRDQIIAQVIALLNDGLPAGVPETQRWRIDDLPPTQLPAICLRPLKETVDPPPGPSGVVVRRTLILRVNHWAKPTSGRTLDQVLDDSLAWVEKALGGSRLITEGAPAGLAWRVEAPEIDWDGELRGEAIGRARQLVVVTYQTRIDDATAPY